MGVTFIGNPFDQETEYDDSDWEMNGVEEWIMPPQEVALVDEEESIPIGMILSHDDDFSDSNDSDEDYFPDEDSNSAATNLTFEEDLPDIQGYVFGLDEVDGDDDDEGIDYVTYPIRDENTTEPEKLTESDTVNSSESSDAD